MSMFQGILGRQVSVTGATTIIIGNTVFQTSNVPIWYGGYFGLSVTSIGTQAFSVYITGDLGGITVPIAGISGVATTTSTLIPLLQERIIGTNVGTTQSAVYGIPTPRRIVFGNSSTPGQTYSAVVSAVLFVS